MIKVKVKWGKELLELTVNLQSTVKEFKDSLYTLTAVPVERQKIMGIKAGALTDSATLSDVGVVDGKTLMLIGTADDAPKAAVPPPAEVSVEVGAVKAGAAFETEMPNGLQNIANTCYMNAAIQMLRLVPEVRQLLEPRTTDPLLSSLGQLYKTMDGAKDAVLPLPFWSTLTVQCPTFNERDDRGNPIQHDSQEVLNILLQRISEVVPESQKRLFQGALKQTTTCKEAPDDTPAVQDLPFLMLSCNINSEIQSLEVGLNTGFNEMVTLPSETLSRDAPFSRTSRISTLPEYLFVHLVRFSWRNDTQKKAKILRSVTFPLVLDLFTLCTEELKTSMEPERAKVMERRDRELDRRREMRQKKRHEGATEAGEVPPPPESLTDTASAAIGNTTGYYELCGVISHKGRTADSGHYVFWGKNDDQWLVLDDEHVATVSEGDVKRLEGGGEAHSAYVLMYRTRDPRTKNTALPL
ncbi:ubiquitin hydrolase [Trypanosoma grayi]|uniref:ubiquitin hydrolase n=1 Tax=Trypanosoma grayi TaxID=71804 RepID=UPI0004F45768|nr:ubiquitin hydrolase [Trypanosoma grayi]KEG13517.1 ubiquitin hydrolase [Trypanosoma grayi]